MWCVDELAHGIEPISNIITEPELMARKANVVEIPSLGTLDRTAGQLGRQLAQALRSAIRRGDLKPGELLPSTRILGKSLTIARGTVIEAFEQLIAEGFTESQGRAGTRVARSLAEASPTTRQEQGRPTETRGRGRPLPESNGSLRWPSNLERLRRFRSRSRCRLAKRRLTISGVALAIASGREGLERPRDTAIHKVRLSYGKR